MFLLFILDIPGLIQSMIGVCALPLLLSHHTLGSAEHLLIDGTFGSTIAANLLESFTGQGLCRGNEGALATWTIKLSTGGGIMTEHTVVQG